MEPYTKPLKSEAEIAPGQLLLHRECGVARFDGTRTFEQGLFLSLRLAEGFLLVVSCQELEKVQVICTDEGPEQPLLDRAGYKPQEWKRFLTGMRDGTIFRHYLSPLTSDSPLSPGQLLLHVRHGVAEYCGLKSEDGKPVWLLEFANGWRQNIPAEDRQSVQIIHIDPTSGRRPELDPYPKQNWAWERFLFQERGRRRLIPKAGGTPNTLRATIKESVRHEVWRRDGGKCVRCESREKLEFDHIVPLSKGGSDTARNIELLCENCNRKKGARI